MYIALLLACAGPQVAEPAPALHDTPALAPMPPPGEPLTLLAVDPEEGGALEFMVGNADPGEDLNVVLSTSGLGPGPCPAPLGGLCVGLAPPLNLLGARADADGTVVFRAPLPRFFSDGDPIGIQVFAQRGPGGRDSVASPPVEVTVGGGGACADQVVDFEGGFWPLDGWVQLEDMEGDISFDGYWGDFSLVNPDWSYLPEPSTTAPGTIISGTVKPGSRVYVGFDSSAEGTKSFVIAANTGDVRFQDNPFYDYTELNIEPIGLDPGSWYSFEIEIMDANNVQGRLYTAAGDPLALVDQDYSAYGGLGGGGLALRGFGEAYIDQVLVACP